MKKLRQKALVDFIKSNIVDTQDDIQRNLEEQGFKVTQATVSRDIKELRIIKSVDAEGVYRYIYNEPQNMRNLEKKFIDIFNHSVIKIQYAMNDVVVKCHPGTASAACAAIDDIFTDDVVGTLAGDDTILAITRSEADAELLVKKLQDLLD